jgi:hypothetical protein
MTCSHSFAQLQVVNQKQIILDKKDEITIKEFGQKGFMVIQSTASEESRKLRTWTFTMYNLDLEQQWTKSFDYEKKLQVLAMNVYQQEVDLVFFINNGYSMGLELGEKVYDLTIMKVTVDGEVTKKDIEFPEKITLYQGNFINDAYYFDATVKKEDVIMKIDFSTLMLTSNRFNLPDNTDISERNNDGKNIYFRVQSTKKKVPYDMLYTIEDGVVVEKTALKKVNNEEIIFMRIIKPDSAHKFVLGLSKKEIQGARKRDDVINYNYYITSLQDEELKSINKIDKEISEQLYFDRSVSIKNKFFGTTYVINGGGFILSSCFRYNNKNFIVFDKYQKIYSQHETYNGKTYTTYYVFESYYYTNTIVWCFTDEGEVEWSKNFEYDIISPYFHEKTCARPYKDNTIALIGHFNNELSFKTIAVDGGDVIEGTENQKVSNRTKYADLAQFNNSINHLYDNLYLIWGNDEEFSSGEGTGKKKEKKDKNIVKMMLKIVEFK